MEIKADGSQTIVDNSKLLDKDLKVIDPKAMKTLRCGNCNKPLMEAMSEKTSKEVIYHVLVECPFCRDASFGFPVYGLLRAKPVADVRWVNIVTDDEKHLVIYKTEKG